MKIRFVEEDGKLKVRLGDDKKTYLPYEIALSIGILSQADRIKTYGEEIPEVVVECPLDDKRMKTVTEMKMIIAKMYGI